jgi:hypothetical protein
MPFSPKLWRQAVRAGFGSGAANPIASGPWMPDGWYGPHWHGWRKANALSLSIIEAKTTTKISEFGPEYTSGPRDRNEDTITESVEFEATVTDLWRGPLIDMPDGRSGWFHGSRTPWGEGLYHCSGQFLIRGTKRTKYKFVHKFYPAEGGEPDIVVREDTDETEDAVVSMLYETDPAALNGLATFCRMSVQQYLQPEAGAYWDLGQWFPQPDDMDGNPSIPPDPVYAENYWTDTALDVLASGSWSAEMILTSGFLREDYGPNSGGYDNGDYRSHGYSRSGTLNLAMG